MVINNKASRKKKFFILHTTYFLLKFVGIIFLIEVLVAFSGRSNFIIWSHIITESSIILAIYLLLSRAHLA